MEREQVAIYLRLQRPDLASAVYTDILGGAPNDTVVFSFLHDKDPVIRTGAVRVLGLAGQARAIPQLAEATKDSDQDVRRAAVAALGTIKDPSAVPPLIDALKDSYWFARSDAADALGRAHDPRAIDPLFALIGDPDKTVQSAAENALVLIAAAKGAPADPFAARLNDSNPKVVMVSAVCLAVKKDNRATPVLLKLAASTDPEARLHAVKALGELGDPSVLPTLRPLLKDSEVNVRGWTIIGLGKLNDSASVPALRAIAADPNQPQNVREAANAAVDHITGVPASPADRSPATP
jgi:HEAT repeat protein